MVCLVYAFFFVLTTEIVRGSSGWKHHCVVQVLSWWLVGCVVNGGVDVVVDGGMVVVVCVVVSSLLVCFVSLAFFVSVKDQTFVV